MRILKANKTLHATPDGAVSSATADESHEPGVRGLSRSAKMFSDMVILVSPLSQVNVLVAKRAPERIVSLLDPDTTFPDFGSIYAARHLRLRLHDVHAAGDGQVAATPKHIDDLLAFISGWQRSAPLLIHCRAGMGRSPAAAFIAACACNPGVDELEVARVLRCVSPTSRPNEALIGFADTALGRGGRMVAAITETGRGLPWPDVREGHPFEMPVVMQPNKAPESTLSAVTDRAGARSAPAGVVAHFCRSAFQQLSHP